MTSGDVATVVLAVVAGLGLIAAIVKWFFNRGGAEREMTIALDRNTEATKELSGHFYGFRTLVTDELHDHDIRLTKLEATPNVSVSVGAPPDRNASPPG